MLDKIFKAYDVRATYPDMLNEEAAWKIGYATAQFLSRATGMAKQGTMLVSRDMRPSSPSLCEALVEGIRCSGVNVIDLGMCDTSFMYFAVNHLDAIGGIQTTASHNPVNYNGFKISARQAKPVGAQTGLKEIQQAALNLPEGVSRDSLEPTGKYEERDLWQEYRDHVLQFYTPPKEPMKVFVDASNGMAGVLVPKVLEGLENLEIIPLNFEIGQGFAHEPNPLVAENMIPTQEGVKKQAAALGACFDGDADRCMFTDEQGNILGCDHLTALLAEHFAQGDNAKAIVYDLRSSKAVEETIHAHKLKPVRSRVGHVFMKAALRESEGVFGGELSGHFYYRDNYYADSGAITFALVVSLLGQSDKPMSELIAPFIRYPQSGEINFKTEDKEAVMQKLKDMFQAEADVDELDGITVDAWDKQVTAFEGLDSISGFWFNVRASNTEPLLRLNMEAKDQATLEAVLGQIKPMLGEVAEGH